MSTKSPSKAVPAPKKNEKTPVPPIRMSIFPRRSYSDEFNEFANNFASRVMGIFQENRESILKTFQKDSDDFLKTLNIELIRDEQSRYVTLVRLVKILKTSTEPVRELFNYKTTLTLVRLTNFNCTIDVALIEELIKVVIHVEEHYHLLLPHAENSREITSFALHNFIATHYVPKMVEEPENPIYYAAFATGIIFFFLDARRKEVIQIQDLLSSTLLMHLEACIEAENNCYDMPPFDYFTVQSFREALKEFRSLDIDRNGVLSLDEMLVFRNFYFNQLFISRVFEISHVYEGGCIDFKAFIDLLCSIKFRWTTAAAKYHFEAMDLKGDGILDADEIRTMSRLQTHVMPEFTGSEDANTDTLTAELKDMLHLKKSITLEEFMRHRMHNTFTGVITNYVDYSKYERREQ